ncbi:MAG: hypothetical protein K0U74_01870 [Alphaproteobacteria bacterium]|nr:hypothetical protein [Alphaproteobacteria bacterium]
MLRASSLLALSIAALLVTGCGVAGTATQLPSLDRTAPANLLDAKQSKAAMQQMAREAEQREKQALREIEKSR